MTNYIYPKALLYLSLSFALFVVIGTVSHELGHIAVARYLGYDTQLSFASMNYENPALVSRIDQIYSSNKQAIENDGVFGQKEEYETLKEEMKLDHLLIACGGPAQTILTGFVGLFILFTRRKKLFKGVWKYLDWMAIFLALFWSREILNLVISVAYGLLIQEGNYFGGDEKYISLALDLWEGSIPLILGAIGLLVSVFVIFKMIPAKLRITFMASGIVGGLLAMALWMGLIGPAILP